jgi:hypothetical protein
MFGLLAEEVMAMLRKPKLLDSRARGVVAGPSVEGGR